MTVLTYHTEFDTGWPGETVPIGRREHPREPKMRIIMPAGTSRERIQYLADFFGCTVETGQWT